MSVRTLASWKAPISHGKTYPNSAAMQKTWPQTFNTSRNVYCFMLVRVGPGREGIPNQMLKLADHQAGCSLKAALSDSRPLHVGKGWSVESDLK